MFTSNAGDSKTLLRLEEPSPQFRCRRKFWWWANWIFAGI